MVKQWLTISAHTSKLGKRIINDVGIVNKQSQERIVSFSSEARPINVLVVESNHPEMGSWQQVVLKGVNAGKFKTTRVGSLTRALSLLEQDAYDVILLDLSLPDSLGINTFSEMYAHVPEVPILVTTAAEDKTQAFEVLREGAQDYLVKGELDANILSRALHYAIERHRSRVLLQQMSFYDDLTGLLNRRGFLSLAQQQLKIAQRENWDLVVLFADLDSLKNVNDSFGHPEGDRALRTVATILKETFRTSDLIARLGGDEFIVLALNAPATGVQTMTDRLQRNIERHNAQNRYYQISLSVGIVQFDPQHGLSLDEMIVKADQALYENKRKKRQSVMGDAK
jgi:diguanylate cyclase (GGDEF)-like protein